ncbi:HSP20 family protein [Desulfobaculum xiamenense]|uniref:HSP20 family protein n=1 Tax=Desulfobaculum xiamenense TaxID=995050 RepID=A0A846QUA8_9BACT|nr:Hsp20/alpha crystallin family protein [Desulfobaculum xiamenense]NJB69085.1 HSP20 family protein [Desulfobaculum xiamenense]
MVIDFGTLYDFPRDLNRFFEEMMQPISISQRRTSYPPVNVSEDANALYIHACVPGIAMDELDITVTENDLVIKGVRKADEGRYYRQERGLGAFQRIFNITTNIDRDNVKATLKNGILEIVLPKAEAVKPRKISISA